MLAIFPEIIECAQTGNSENLAQLVRNYFAGSAQNSHRLDVEKILDQIGIVHSSLDLDYLGAIAAKDHDGRFQISIITTRELPYQDRTFLLAHLLGHYLLHIQPHIAHGDWTEGGFKELTNPIDRYATDLYQDELHLQRQEREADTFAAALLFPMHMVEKASEHFHCLRNLAHFFLTHEACMSRRQGLMVRKAETSQTPSNFLAAERQLDAENQRQSRQDLSMNKKTHITPKSFAAAQYSSLAQSSKTDTTAPAQDGIISERGMSKLRRIARELDKFR